MEMSSNRRNLIFVLRYFLALGQKEVSSIKKVMYETIFSSLVRLVSSDFMVDTLIMLKCACF